jgi:hypothetical protein
MKETYRVVVVSFINKYPNATDVSKNYPSESTRFFSKTQANKYVKDRKKDSSVVRIEINGKLIYMKK